MSEREWRRQNLEWERRRREAEQEAERLGAGGAGRSVPGGSGLNPHMRPVDERRAKMELRAATREQDYKKKKEDEIKDKKDLSLAVKVRHSFSSDPYQ